ncbi:hypothetical protein ACJ51O_02325 [Burkholderia pyrrocinia]|uniref:hypothetical protein n=1 Tax=Burkholderia pyrrocinia TaxID=60550 RepID=UPI0038B491F6
MFAVPAVFLVARIRVPLPASADLMLCSAVRLTPFSQILVVFVGTGSLLMIGTPRRLERIHGRPVILTGD